MPDGSPGPLRTVIGPGHALEITDVEAAQIPPTGVWIITKKRPPDVPTVKKTLVEAQADCFPRSSR